VSREQWMARTKDLMLKFLSTRRPLISVLAREVVKSLSLLSYEDRVFLGAVDRPHYGYCVFQAAKLAMLLNYPRVSVIEFGCGGGNGLISLEMHILEVMKIFPVDIDLYGFDGGSGLPNPKDYRDAPHYFKGGLYRMDRASLEEKLKRAKLVIGNVKDTCTTFFEKYNPAPIACVFHDLDYYSSTVDALGLFNADSSYFLPRVFMYFDDIFGDDLWLCNDYTGERLAIAEFNQTHRLKKICPQYSLPLQYPDTWWPPHVCVYHDFEHPRYNDFIAEEKQAMHSHEIKLK
jgi:hypothetical protein